MNKIVLGVVLLLLPIFLNASFVLKNEIGLNEGGVAQVNRIGDELYELTGVEAFVVATTVDLERGESAYDLIETYIDESKDQIFLLLAPDSQRIHVLSKTEYLDKGVNKSKVTSFAIDIIAARDKNSIVDKYAVGVVQSYSELADQIAALKGVELSSTISNSTQNTVNFLRVLVYVGTVLIFYAMFLRPYINKRRKNKEEKNRIKEGEDA